MDSAAWRAVGSPLCTLLRRAAYCKLILQNQYGKTDRIYKRFILFELSLDTMRVCLSSIMESDDTDISPNDAFYDNSDWIIPAEPTRIYPLPKTLTEDQQAFLASLLADTTAYVDSLDIYPFGYHSQLRVYRNAVLNKINLVH